MYKVSSGGKIIAICDKPRFIKLNNESGAYVEAGQAEAIGVVVGGKVYNYGGNQIAEGAEEVIVSEIDSGELLLNLQAEAEEAQSIGQIVFATLAENETLPEEKIIEHPEVFEDWKAEENYKAKQIVKEGDDLFRCLQDHTSQNGWNPKNTAALWVQIAKVGEYREIKDNMLATEAFALNEIGWFRSKDNLFKSLIANNVYTPETYPTGWEHV